MRKPSALHWQLRPDPLWMAAGTLLAFVSAAAPTLWACAWLERLFPAPNPDPGLGLAISMITGLGAALLTLRRMRRRFGQGAWLLHFDGERWHWACGEGPPATGTLRCALDLGYGMLLQVRAHPGHGASAWLWAAAPHVHPAGDAVAAEGSLTPWRTLRARALLAEGGPP